ncbi:MAG: L,D-transpeptidase family protein [Gammaproteobacteria bacterium]|nr:L,D-transpeptidase family protein [Gammaproteobacteria bacterium]
MRTRFFTCFMLFFCLLPATFASQKTLPIDKVLVIKSERQLHLMHRGEIVKTYKVSLGKKDGAKSYEGDLRTPEGIYWLDWRKPSERYNLAINISYPNEQDRERAQQLGKNPGSMIMLHGTPNDEEYPEWFFSSLNWTEGCIALTNDDMQEVWSLVKDNTLIEIRP